MSFYLSKLTSLLVLPVGLVLVAAFLAAIALFWGRNRLAFGLIVAQIIGLWVCAAPVTAEWLVASLEQSWLAVPVEQSESADAAVVLGGALGAAVPPRIRPDLGKSADRVLHAARLYKAGKVGKIIVTGGFMPWRGVPISEATMMRDLLVEWGVPARVIILEGNSRNTRENAINTQLLFEANQIGKRGQITRHSVNAIDRDHLWLVDWAFLELMFQIVQVVMAKPTGLAFA